jgi:phosphotransferase family enzyme
MSNDEPLGGGMANPGAVFRRGDSVVRPAPASWEALHTFLLGLRAEGFVQAPVPSGPVVDGVEELEFLPGEVPVDPMPDWADHEPILASVGTLLRKYHAAAGGVPFDKGAPWSTELADPQGGPLLCHNDVCHENVVFREGNARAIIDFDFAAPGRPVWDLAMTAWYWVPMRDLEVQERELDPYRRLRLLADAYGLTDDERPGFMTVMEEAVGVCRTFVAARVDRGERPFVERLEHHGGWSRWDRIQAWLADRHDQFTEALTT